MPTVKVLIDAVGGWNKGDVVKDAPPGLVHIAKSKTRNAATGELIAELIEDDDDSEELRELKAKAKELKIPKYTKMSADELKEAITAAEKETAEAEELKVLQTKAAELEIADFEKMNRAELITAIEAAGGGQGAE